MDEQVDPSEEVIDRVHEVMKGESDRGCVLVGASLIEWKMAELLKAVFLARHPDKTEAGDIEKQIDRMLNPTHEKSILGAAAARGRMCRVLNLITESMHRLLKEFLVFRNDNFAHAHSDVKFTDPNIKRGLDRLVKAVPPYYRDNLDSLNEQTERNKFVTIVVILFFVMDYQYQND